MTSLQELEVDFHLLEASNLKPKSRGYNAFKRLLSTGKLLSNSLGDDYTIFVNFTKVLDYLRLEYEFITGGLELRDNAKVNYRQNVMFKKHKSVVINNYPIERQRVGKEEIDHDKPGWCDRQLANKTD